MPRITKKLSKKAGLHPGALVYVGKERDEEVKIRIIDYDEAHFEEREVKNVEECFAFKYRPTVTWINIEGIQQVDVIETIGKQFGLHPLVMEDIVNTDQRPKIEDFGNYIFTVLKMIYYSEKEEEIQIEQLSIIIGEHFVISCQEKEPDIFNTIRHRIRNNNGRIRKMGTDYLAYALMDGIIDSYFVILETVGDKLESIQEELVTNPMPETLQEIHDLKRDMIFMRKSVWPLREVIGSLEKAESKLVQESTQLYFRDVYDHTIQVMDAIETSRDMLSGMLDIYLSSVSNRMNEVMKVLTIISTIFIPLTLIAGIYGMNFHYMPELSWRWGYFGVLIIMAVIGISMLIYFKKKRWF